MDSIDNFNQKTLYWTGFVALIGNPPPACADAPWLPSYL